MSVRATNYAASQIAGLTIWLAVQAPAWAQDLPPATPSVPAADAAPPTSAPPVADGTPVAPTPPAAVYETQVRGRGNRLRNSQEAVEVVNTGVARSEAGNLRTVLDSTKGVVLRQSGGLGSPTTFSLAGLSGNRVRFFIDGVPADAAGFGLNPLDLPLSLLDRVEIYKGVVPIRFGADSLAGAVNFVTRDMGDAWSLETSVELASFGTFRGSQVAAVPLGTPLNLYIRPQAFFDRAANDYSIDVQVPNARGQLVPARVKRFHDGYQAFGLGAEVGLQRVPWADKLSLRVFHGQNDRALQSNIFVTVPYGDLNLGDQATSGILHYLWRSASAMPVEIEALLSYAHREGYVNDITRNIWNWRALITGARAVPGERGNGSRVLTASNPATARLTAGLRLAEHSRLELNLAPAYTDWTQNNQSVVTATQPWVQTQYSLFKVVAGAAWQLRLLDGQLKNDLFAKFYHADPHGPVTAIINNAARPTPSNRGGGGDSLRYAIVGPLAAKASYEYATRVPDAQELFGDGLLIVSNAALLPETSHNVNLGLTAERWDTPWGRIDLEGTFFFRRTRDLIFLVVGQDSAQYQNISDVDSTGVELGGSWAGLGPFTLSANGTYLNAVSQTTGGYFRRFLGNRIPNLPYLYANGAASMNFGWVTPELADLRLYWRAHYVHDYFLFWENDGDPTHKLIIPAQFLNHLGISGSTPDRRFTGTFEVRNLADAKVYDNVGQQLAGRSLHLKLIVRLD